MAKKMKSTRVCAGVSFRFDPDLIQDARRVIYLTQEGDNPKYGSLTGFVVVALKNLIRKERRNLESQGVAWENLRSKFEKIKQEE